MNDFFGSLDVRYINGKEFQLLNREDKFGLIDYKGRTIIPDDGFITNFTDVPDIFSNIWPKIGEPGNEYGPASVIHDWLYVVGKIDGVWITQQDADMVFIEACLHGKYKVKRRTTRIFAECLCRFGYTLWNNHNEPDRPSSGFYKLDLEKICNRNCM